ncbi:hypothetical protein FOMPIDRAFT_89044 [Fomitopsis schrenkii]|uniref:MYND-type domain-containing protein n=1 Tax=Fomitopsis schrenkii TaxID=2126942 RepID=S8FPW7_FOMSC|nr:hypothetical protein FOMPIDRAFT_89044 [Fomitopsis schrenkii]
MVLPTLRHNLRIFTDERIAELHRTFVRVGITFNEYKSPLLRENAHPAITQAKEDMLSLPDDPIQSALGSFLLVARAQYCFSPECQQTFVDAGRPFARCAGCEVLRYCSRECQRQAWKHPTLPHKSVCAKLRALRGRAGLMRDQNWGSADGPGRRVFADACSADEELAAFADECGRHLAVLTAERLQNLDGPSIKESEELEGKGLDRVVDWGTIRVLDSADWHASR